MSKSNDPSPWPTLTLMGVLCGLALGAVIVLLIRSSRRTEPPFPEVEDDFLDRLLSPTPRLLPTRTAKSGRGPSLDGIARARVVPVARTATISNDEPTMLLQAVGKRDWTVDVRTVGPSGAFATFMIGNSSGNSIVVPAGGHHRMRIPHGEFLYAQGDTPGTFVSVSGGEG